MENQFDALETEQFRKRMRQHAETIYRSIFPGSRLEDLREDGVRIHMLDKEFAIDTLWHLPSGQWLSVQEKYRHHDYLVNPRLQIKPPSPDFTQEYMNAVGTEHESQGEWFHLAAHLYFYGWANADQTGFERWVLLNVPRYKAMIEAKGGLHRMGTLIHNQKHGRATFYAIPLVDLQPAIILDEKKWAERIAKARKERMPST